MKCLLGVTMTIFYIKKTAILGPILTGQFFLQPKTALTWEMGVLLVMILCLFALIVVVLIYCVLSIVVIIINIIFVMCDIDHYYYSYLIYVATLYIELDLIYCLHAIAASLL